MILIDRDEEIAALDALLHDCTRGEGIVTRIYGPVGSGKTALLRAFTERAGAAGATLGCAVASRAERGLPLGVVRQLFRSRQVPAFSAARADKLIGGGTPTGQPGEPGPDTVDPVRARAFEGVLELVAELSERGPVVLAVDDVHQADVASLQCLAYLARRTSALPVVTIMTEGTHALPADRLLQAEILRQGNCHGIPLRMLSLSGVARLLAEHLDARAAGRLAADCHAMTGGNPLLVHAVGKDSRAAAGQSADRLFPGAAFRAAVATCLHRHEPDTVELGQAIAILSRDATVGLLGDLLAVTAESAAAGISVLSSSGLLESGHYRHEQARQAVLDHMTADERTAMHGGVARALYQMGAASATLARHLVAADRIGARWAVTALQETAQQALAVGEADRAIHYLRRAERQCADEQQRASIAFSLVCAQWPRDPERAARHLPALVANARASMLEGECLGKLASCLLWVGDTDNAAEILAVLGTHSADVASGLAESVTVDGMMRSPLEFLYPDVAHSARRASRDAEGAARAAAAARPHQADPPRPSAASDIGAAAVAAAERVLAERVPDDPTLTSITTALMTLIAEDMLDRAASWCEILLHESEASPLQNAILTALFAMIEARWGNLAEAEDDARRALALLTRKAWGVAIGGPLSSLLLSTTASRKHADAAACLRTPVPEAMFGTVYGVLYLYARGEYYLATERPRLALADFSDCGRRMVMWGLDMPGLVPWRAKAAEAHLAMGDSVNARELSKEQLAQAGAGSARVRGISLRTFGITSHPAKRTALLRESAELLRDSGARLELVYTFIELSKAHLALGEHNRARWAGRQARDLAERCGAQIPATALGSADTDRRESGNGVGANLLAQLSDAEQRVATLAAYGYTNAQVAHKLHITVSTVEQHLTRVYRKLGVASRVELPVDILLRYLSYEQRFRCGRSKGE